MKVIFLDVDGVLNSEQSHRQNYRDWVRKGCPKEERLGLRAVDRPDPICMSNLALILECCPDVRIVISSTWRFHHMKELRYHFRRHNIPWRGIVIGKTWRVRFSGGPRGEEIQAWMDKKGKKLGVEDFIIIDDSDDMLHLKDHLYLTDSDHGLQLKMVEDIIRFFGGWSNYQMWFQDIKKRQLPERKGKEDA